MAPLTFRTRPNEHGNKFVEGARSFILMLQNYDNLELREKYAAEIDAADHHADTSPS